MKQALLQHVTILTIMLLSTAYGSATEKSLLPCRPVDAGAQKDKNSWIIALIDRQVRFRLAPISKLNAPDEAALKREIPDLLNYTAKVTDEAFFTAAQKLGTSHLLRQKFELIHRGKTVNYYAEIVEPVSRRSITQVERDIPLDQLSAGIDSSLLILLPRFGYTLSNNTLRFLSLPVTGTSLKSVKKLGELFIDEGDSTISRAELSENYEKLISKDPFMLLAVHSTGVLNYTSGNYAKSSKYLKELLDITPHYTSLFLLLAKSYRFERRYNDALAVTLQCERNRMKSVPFLLEKARALEGLNQQTAAFTTYKQVLMVNPKELDALLFMARLRNDERKFTEAKKFSLHALKADRNSSDAYLEMGRCQIGLNNYPNAKRALTRALQLESKSPLGQELMGDVLMIENTPDSAFIHYKRACTLRPVELDLYLKASRALEASGKREDALAFLYDISGRFPSKPLLRRQIGLLEFSTGNLDSAVRSISMYLAIKPDDAVALQTAGTAWLKLNNYRKAKDLLQKALPGSADKVTCKLLLAEAELLQNNHLVAQKLLKAIIAEKPVKRAYRLSGLAWLGGNKQREALKAFKKERELHGNDDTLQEHIATLHYNLKQYVAAQKEFEKLAQIAPKNAGAFYHLALIALHKEKTKTGEEYYIAAQKLGAANEMMHYNIGHLFTKNKAWTQAIGAYTTCVSLNKTNEDALCELSGAYTSSGQDTAAAAVNVSLFRINNKKYSAWLAQAGHLYLKNNQEKAAASAYALFLSKGFSDMHVNSAYAGILYRAADFQGTIRLLKGIQGDFARDTMNLLMLSHAYCRTGKFSEALPWLTKLRRITTGIRLEARLSAVASEQCGDTITAIGMYVRLLSFPPDSHHTEEAYHLGTLYEFKKLFENAIARYELNIKESPDDLRSHERLAAIYMSRNDFSNSRRVLETALTFPHVNAPIQKMLAQTYTALNDMDRAAELYTTYLSRVKDDLPAWTDLAHIYYSRKKYSEAINPLRQVSRLQPDNFDAWYQLGVCYIQSDNFTDAIAPLGRARALKPKNLQAIELAARCYRNHHETSTLKTILREWIALDPKRFDIKMEIGSILIKEKEIDEAITMLTDAIRFIPSEAKPHLLLAQAYEFKLDDSLRYIHLQNALRFNPKGWEPHYQLARYYLSKKLGHDAERHFKTAISFYPENGKIHHEYSLYLISRNDFALAASECRMALNAEPDNQFYQILAAFTECMNGKRATAMEVTRRVLAENSDDARILYWAGRIFKETGRYAEARATFDSALVKDGSCALCLEAIGDICMEKVQFKEAAQFYFSSWDKGGYNPQRVFKLGNALFYDRKYLEARDFFETILSKNKKFDDARYRLTAAYCALGEIDKAKEQLPLFVSTTMPWMQLAQGIVHEKEGNTQAALVAYSRAQDIAPQNHEVLAGLGRTYMLQQQADSAMMYLSSASAADTLNMQAMIDLGSVFEQIGQLTSAVQYYYEVDRKYPTYPGVQVRIARIKSQQKAHKTAIRHIKRGLEFHPEDTTLYFMLGQEYTFTNNYKEAVQAFRKSLKLGRNKPVEAFRLIGDIYYDILADSKKARDYYKKYVKAGGGEKATIKRLAGM